MDSPHRAKFFQKISTLFDLIILSVYNLLSDKIKDLLKPGSVSSMTRLALVNAIYFKGNWKNPFDEANTKEMPFKLNKVCHLQFHSHMQCYPVGQVSLGGLYV